MIGPSDEKKMLKSLFGEFVPMKDSGARRHVEKNDFASTAVMETQVDEDDDPAPVTNERHSRDLYINGSATQALRSHYNQLDDTPDSPQHRTITLLDPAQMWAGAVIKALSDASGQPVEKLHLRDQTSQDTLALIERTTLPRRQDETLKVYRTEVQAQGSEALGIPCALMERADLATVVIGPMAPADVDGLLDGVLGACQGNHWHCPDLLFMLPVGATWISKKIEALPWPGQVRVAVLAEPLSSASMVWNKLLAYWNTIRPTPHEATSPLRPEPGATVVHAPIATRPAPAPAIDHEPATVPGELAPEIPRRSGGPDTERASAILHELMLLDGLLFTALVDATNGAVVACEGRGVDIDHAAAAATEVIQTHRRTLRQMGHWRPNEPIDEILVTAGSRYHILRTLQAHPNLFILAVLDKL
ncbi:MAG: hypothetical protein RJA44_1976, partial [Pseudomonadota bacterium]